jgi:hypothetical protein
MTVRVYAGNVVYDEVTFATKNEALVYASNLTDLGIKVRLI